MAMDTLVLIGVSGATPFVLQFILDFISNGKGTGLSDRIKMALSVLVGAILGVLIPLYQLSAPDLYTIAIPHGSAWIFIALNGGISGAIATAAVSLAFKVASKTSQPEDRDVKVSG